VIGDGRKVWRGELERKIEDVDESGVRDTG
jgi:hypothetical protein